MDNGDLSGTGRPRGRPGAPGRPAEPDAAWLTWEQAAQRVGCPVSTIDWHTRTGRIASRPRNGSHPTVDAASVAEFAAWWQKREERRAATAAQRAVFRERRARTEARRTSSDSVPSEPPAEGSWVSMVDAAEQLGCTRGSVRRRIDDGRLTGTRVGQRWWVEETSLAALVAEEARWMSYAAAARLVGCSTATIGEAVRSGEIRQRDEVRRPVASLDRTSVEAYAPVWQRLRAARVESRQVHRPGPRDAGPPDDEHVWLDTATTALVLGVGRGRVRQLAARERLPHVRSDAGRLWFRRDHVEVASAARAERARPR